MILKLHKYFNWADKKLHSVFFLEDKDQISDDLLSDFKEDTGVLKRHGMTIDPKVAKIKPAEIKPKGLIQEEAIFVSHNEFLFGKKPGESKTDIVDINSEKDFPSLGAVNQKAT